MREVGAELPEGWSEAPLRTLLASFESWSRPKGGVRGIRAGIPSLGGEHLTALGGFDLSSIKYVPQEFYSRMNRGHISRGDVLVVKDGATTGKVSLVREDFPFDKAVVNEHVFVCRPALGVSPAFLFWFMRSSEGQRRILENFQGSAQGGINQSFADNTMVPVAPLGEQQRIVTAIEELMAGLAASRGRLLRIPAILQRFRQAVVAAACSGRLTEAWRSKNGNGESATRILDRILIERRQRRGANRARQDMSQPEELEAADLEAADVELPETWSCCTTGSLSQPERALTYGVIKLGPSTPGGVPTLRSSDVRWLFIGANTIKHIEPRISNQYLRTVLQGGEVVVTVRGTLGGVAVIPPEMVGHNVSREVAVIPFESALNAEYLALAIAALPSQNWLAERAKGVAYTGINIRDLKLLPLPIPPRNEQDEIVRRVRDLFGIADAIRDRVQNATKRSSSVEGAILTRAFRGDLIPPVSSLRSTSLPAAVGP